MDKTTQLQIGQKAYPSFLEWLESLSQKEQKTILRHQARTDLYFLLRYVLFRKDMEHPWIFDRCREVQEAPNGYLDLWARDHYKSTVITFGKTIQDVIASHGDDALFERECLVGIFSHSRSISKAFLRQIKQEFESNELLKRLFPDILYAKPELSAPKWSEDDGLIVKRRSNPKESTIEAHGLVEGQPTSKHFTHQVYDDVVVPASVTTPEMMRKTQEALELSYNLGTKGGVKRFIGTRYHFSDAYKILMDRGTVIPRIYPATDDGTATGKPVLISQEALNDKRRDQGPYTFSCQMLLNPKADGLQGFKREWVQFYEEINLEGLNKYILIDPASEKKKGSDYTAGFVLGLGPDKNIYVIDMARDRLNLTQRTKLLMDWHRKYEPMSGSGVRYEKYGMQADIEHIKGEQARQNYRFEITEVGGQTPKNDRIKRLIPHFEQKRIWFPRSMHYTDYEGRTKDLVSEFIEQEYLGFPVPVHDDMLDALSRIAEPDLSLTWPMKASIAKNYEREDSSWMDM